MKTDFNLADFLPYRLAVLAERVSRRLEVEYARSHGLSVAEWRVLVNLSHLGAASVRDIQSVTNLEKSRVSRAVAKLDTAGLVEKHVSPRDARLVEIALTDAGIHTLSEIIPVATEIEARLLQGITSKDLDAFYEVFEHLHSVLDKDPTAKPRFNGKTVAPSKAGER